MNPVETLKAVLCGQDGKCCIAGSQADRDTVDTALAAIQHYLDQHKAELPVLFDWEVSGLWDVLLAWSHSGIDRCDVFVDNAEEIINAQLEALKGK